MICWMLEEYFIYMRTSFILIISTIITPVRNRYCLRQGIHTNPAASYSHL